MSAISGHITTAIAKARVEDIGAMTYFARKSASKFLRCNNRLLEINRSYLHSLQSPGLARRRLAFQSMDYLEPVATRAR